MFKMSPLPKKMIQFDEHIYVERGGSFYQLAQMLHVGNIFLHLPYRPSKCRYLHACIHT